MMRAHLVKAHGSPSATLVIQAGTMCDVDHRFGSALRALRGAMLGAGLGDVLKIAIVGASSEPGVDLNYRFVQVLVDAAREFELRGSCGHSIVAACSVARRLGWVSGDRVRVNVLNTGERVVCAREASLDQTESWAVDFRHTPPTPLDDLLLFGRPVTALPHGRRSLAVSGVSAGNPYVFVSAHDFGVTTVQQLHADDDRLFATLSALRQRAEVALGWPPGGAFPKIAAVLPDGPNRLAVRALSVPRWHPTLALTGAVCLAAATAIPGTVPNELAGPVPDTGHVLTIHTPGGLIAVRATTRRSPAALVGVEIGGRVVSYLRSMGSPEPRDLAVAVPGGPA